MQRHPEKIQEFVDALPPPEDVNGMEKTAEVIGTTLGTVGGAIIGGVLGGPFGIAIGLSLGGAGGNTGTEFAKNHAVDNSEAMKLARRICDEWLLDFKDLIRNRSEQPTSAFALLSTVDRTKLWLYRLSTDITIFSRRTRRKTLTMLVVRLVTRISPCATIQP